MADLFKLPSNATKKILIDKYNDLLEAYERKVTDLGRAEKARSEGERHADRAALKVAAKSKPDTVVDTIGKLRGRVGQHLGELGERLSEEAERLEHLQRAVSVQEKRLSELYEIEAAADALQKLATAYREQREEAEAEYGSRTAALEREQEAARERWAEEIEREDKASSERVADRGRAREREEAEYLYERDRTRKLEEHAWAEKVTAQEKELRETREAVSKELSERELAVKEREKELKELRARVDGMPKELDKAVATARKDEREDVIRDQEQKAALISMEREWEQKMAAQRVAHLEASLSERDAKIKELRSELAAAQKQVHGIAEKAIEGASHSRAFQSVNQIALEQARKPESGALA